MLKGGKYAYTVIDKKDFISWIDTYTDSKVDGNLFFDAFALTKTKIQSQIKGNDPKATRMKKVVHISKQLVFYMLLHTP